MRALIPVALAALILTFAPASAQEPEPCPEGYTQAPEGCSKQAWVDDCPPDMMCAAGAPSGNETDEKPTYDGDCGGEVCAYDTPGNDTVPMGPEDCIACSQPVPDSGTCMDGQQGNETCRDDVQYLGPEPGRGPDDGSCPHCRGNDDAAPEGHDADGSKGSPALALGLLAGALAALAYAARRH